MIRILQRRFPVAFPLLVLLVATAVQAQYRIDTVAGGYVPNGLPAVSVSLVVPTSVVVDSAGNLYIAATRSNLVLRVDKSGQLTVAAGNGTYGLGGDGGPATSAGLAAPTGVALDTTGNLYIADSGNNRIRRVALNTGIITTVAGTGTFGFAGDGGPATDASLDYATSLTIDGSGNMYIVCETTIRRMVLNTGIISTVAGNGIRSFSGDGGPATSASFDLPSAAAVDSAGNLFIADRLNNRIRRVDLRTGIISTIAGNGKGAFGGDGGPATGASLYDPCGLAFDSAGNLYIADHANSRIRRVAVNTGIISTIAGNGAAGFGGDGGPATSASLSLGLIAGVAVDGTADLYIVDTGNDRIRRVVLSTGMVTTIAGNGTGKFSGDGGAATSADLDLVGVAVDGGGNLYMVDWEDDRVRRVDLASGLITTIAVNATPGPCPSDIIVTSPPVAFPALDTHTGGPTAFRRAVRAATSLIASGSVCNPQGIATDGEGNLFIASSGSNVILRLDTSGQLTAVAGISGPGGFGGDGGLATNAKLFDPSGVGVDSTGSLYIADYGNNRIRQVTRSTGIISTVAGGGNQGSIGDGGPATGASLSLSFASGVAADSLGNLYIADTSHHRIRRVVLSTGIITTVAGTGTGGYSGDGGPAVGAMLNYPSGVAVDNARSLYIADASNNRIRRVDLATGVISTIAGNGARGFGGDGGPATSATLSLPRGVAVDTTGIVYIADEFNYRIRRLTPIASPRPNISVAPSSLSFTIDQAAGAGATKTLSITSSGTALAIMAETSTSSGGSWLGVSPIGGTTPTALTVSVTTILQPGSYEGTVTITALEASNSPVKIPVSLIVTTPPLTITTTSLPMAVVGLAYGPVQFGVTGATGATTWSETGLPSLTGLSLSPSGILSGTPAKGSQGTYLITVTVASSGTTAKAQFTLTINAATTLDVLTFRLVPSGGANLSDMRVFAVGNDSPQPAKVQVVPSAPWIKTSTSQINFVSGAGPQPVSVQIDRTALPPGPYASGTISLQGLSSPKQVEVYVALQDQRGLPLLSRSAMTFYVQQSQLRGEGDNVEQDITIINDGPKPVGWSITKSDSFISVDPSRSTVPLQPGESASVKVTVSDRDLTVRTWQAILSFLFDDNSLTEFPVSVVVSLAALPSELLLDKTGLIFIGGEHQSIGIQNYTSQDYTVSVVPLQSWIKVLPTSTSVTQRNHTSFDVSIDPAAAPLAPGLARGWIAIGYRDSSNQTVLIQQVEVLFLGAQTVSGAGLISSADSASAAACQSSSLQAVFSRLSEGATVAVGLPAQIDVKITDNCGNAVKTGAAAVSFSNADPPVTLLPDGSGSWQGTWSPRSGKSAVLFMAAVSGQQFAFGTATRSVQLDSSGVKLPSVPTGAVLNAASLTLSVDRVAPGSIISIFGDQLATGTAAASSSLPFSLASTTVRLGTTPLPLFYVSPTQINALVPAGMQLDPTTSLVVESAGFRSIPVPVVSLATDPGIFNGAVVSATGKPAQRGDTVLIYCTGLGSVTESLDPTLPTPLDHLVYTKQPVAVFIQGAGGQWLSAYVSFAGLAPGYSGLYQVNVQIPNDAATGDQVALYILSGARESNRVSLAVR